MSADLSVVVPLFDAAPWVPDAIGSLLANADGLLEVIVVDDASTDGGAEVAEAFGSPVRVLRQPTNGGPAVARNVGVAAARGDLVSFLDADDLWVAGRPDSRRASLADPAVDFVCGRARCVAGPPGQTPVPVDWPDPTAQLATMLVRRAACARIGPFDAALHPTEDLDWLLRAREAVSVAEVDAVCVLHRRRPGSFSSRREAVDRAVLATARASMLRRRSA